ncbi:unnamed protein product [Calypogeia fissa]
MAGGAAAAACLSSKFLTTFFLATASPASSSCSASSARAAPSFNRSIPRLSSSSSWASSSLALFSSSQILVPALRPQRQRQQQVAMASSDAAPSVPKVEKSEEEWRTVLSPEQFRILRQKGTEWANTGEYDKFSEDGLYECAGCKTPLYKSTTKFNSGCGWPAFYEGLPGAITETPDPDGRRIEITCTACGGHLGHTFKGEGFPTPTDERHCVNSISLKFTPANK